MYIWITIFHMTYQVIEVLCWVFLFLASLVAMVTIQILDEAVCILICANALEKSMNPFLLCPSAMGDHHLEVIYDRLFCIICNQQTKNDPWLVLSFLRIYKKWFQLLDFKSYLNIFPVHNYQSVPIVQIPLTLLLSIPISHHSW